MHESCYVCVRVALHTDAQPDSDSVYVVYTHSVVYIYATKIVGYYNVQGTKSEAQIHGAHS